MHDRTHPGLERSCACATDWIRCAPPQPGLERIEAFFAGHAFDLHRHDTYALGVTLTGVQCFAYRGVRQDSLAGNAIVLHPDERHDGHSGIETGFRYRMLYLAPRLIRDALGTRVRSLPFVRNAVTTESRLLAALQLALADIERMLEPLEIDRTVTGIAEALLAHDRSPSGRAHTARCPDAIARACEFLDAHFTQVVASETLEAVTGLDRYSLTRQFRAQLGTSPYRYLTMRRLDLVRARIAAGDGLADAALDAGFADQAHMTRQFRQAYGQTPGRWRSMLLAAA